jgi:hypothetical protein
MLHGMNEVSHTWSNGPPSSEAPTGHASGAGGGFTQYRSKSSQKIAPPPFVEHHVGAA